MGSVVLIGLGNCYCDRGERADAERAYKECLVIRREIDDQVGAAYALNALGNVCVKQSRWVESKHYYEESLDIEKTPEISLVSITR